MALEEANNCIQSRQQHLLNVEDMRIVVSMLQVEDGRRLLWPSIQARLLPYNPSDDALDFHLSDGAGASGARYWLNGS